MAYFTPAGAAHGAGFANAVRRHIILMHITLAGFVAYAVQHLGILKGAERGYGHNLGLAAGKHGAAVRAGQQTNLAPYGAYLLHAASVGADAAVDYLIAHYFLGYVIKYRVNILGAVGVYFKEMLGNLLLHLGAARFALVAVKCVKAPLHLIEGICAHKLGELRTGLIDVHFHLGLAHFRLHVFYKGDNFLYVAVGEQNGLQHFVLAQLVRARFNHHNGVLRAGNGQMQLALFALLAVRVDYILPVDIANAYRAGGAHEGRVAYGEGGA